MTLCKALVLELALLLNMTKTGYVYILTNKHRTVLYVGVTNNLQRRLTEHVHDSQGFVKRYNLHFMVYYESINGMRNAIQREKQIKGWTRAKKDELVASMNPDWDFLNDTVLNREP